MPSRKPLVTLRDAALYITKLPKAEHDADEWRAAMQALLLVAERNGPTMLARIGMMKALNRHGPKPGAGTAQTGKGVPDCALAALDLGLPL